MRERGLTARRPHHRTLTTQSEPEARVAPHVLAQDLTATRANEKWTGDVTDVWTSEGWLAPSSGTRSLLASRDGMGTGYLPG